MIANWGLWCYAGIVAVVCMVLANGSVPVGPPITRLLGVRGGNEIAERMGLDRPGVSVMGLWCYCMGVEHTIVFVPVVVGYLCARKMGVQESAAIQVAPLTQQLAELR